MAEIIEIKIIGRTREEIIDGYHNLANVLGVDVSPVSNMELSLSDLLEMTKARFAAEGYNVEVSPTVEAAIADAPGEVDLPAPRRGRKPKMSPEEAKAVLSEEVSEPDTADEEQLKALKDATILKLQEMYVNGQPDRVNALLKKHGDGAERFSDIAAAKFPEIAAELE
jgi:hypothetical protein